MTETGETAAARLPVRRPVWIGSTVAVLASALAVGLVGSAPEQLAALGVALVGVGVLAVGTARRHRGRRTGGTVLVCVAGGVFVCAVALGLVWPATATQRIELFPGLLGVALLGTGVVAFRGRWARVLVAAGAGAVLVSALTSGVVHDTSKLPLLSSVAASVVAWDAGENAVTLGEQVGRRAASWRPGLVHSAGSLAVGGAGVLVAVVTFEVGATGLPLVGLVALVGAVLALSLALAT